MSARISFDKPYDLRGDVSARMISNIDEMLGQLYWTVAQLEGKLSGGQGLLSSQNTSITQESGAVLSSITNWLSGPWTLDGGSGRSVAALRNDPPAGTYNNFEPSGIATAVLLELEPSGAVTLTGLKAPTTDTKRLLLLRNRDSSSSITLKHANAGSSTRNQFSLPSSTDVVMGPGQSAWMYYDTGRTAWTLAITKHTSGGLASTSSVSLVSVSLTKGQLESLSVTPVQVIAAAGASTIVIPIMWAYQINVSTAYSNAPAARLRYTGNTSNLANTIGSRASSSDISHATNIAQAFAEGVGTFDPRNKDVEVSFDTALTGAGAATAKVRVIYYTADFS